MTPLKVLLLNAPRLGDKYGVNIRARLTDERLKELFYGAELSRDELVLLRVLEVAIDGGGVIQEPMRPGRYHSINTPGDPESTYAEDYEWWKLLAQHLPPQATSSMVPTLRKVVAEKYLTVDYRQIRPTVIRSTPKHWRSLALINVLTDEKAYVLGRRALDAGLEYRRGMYVMNEVDVPKGGVLASPGLRGSYVVRPDIDSMYTTAKVVPDLRDPGTKGHAVAQLRERTGDPLISLYAIHAMKEDDTLGWFWSVESPTRNHIGKRHLYPTEEEAIAAAFEAIKENP